MNLTLFLVCNFLCGRKQAIAQSLNGNAALMKGAMYHMTNFEVNSRLWAK
jgi:hypothetical protein